MPPEVADLRAKACRMASGPSLETLNLQQMIGGLTAGHRADLEKLVFRANTVGSNPGGHWQ